MVPFKVEVQCNYTCNVHHGRTDRQSKEIVVGWDDGPAIGCATFVRVGRLDRLSSD